uniref:Uncharacterized protein n=1 Tax=Anopheles atroparvus TaxID=41427 RepID=A0A182JE27_ANOAO
MTRTAAGTEELPGVQARFKLKITIVRVFGRRTGSGSNLSGALAVFTFLYSPSDGCRWICCLAGGWMEMFIVMRLFPCCRKRLKSAWLLVNSQGFVDEEDHQIVARIYCQGEEPSRPPGTPLRKALPVQDRRSCGIKLVMIDRKPFGAIAPAIPTPKARIAIVAGAEY